MKLYIILFEETIRNEKQTFKYGRVVPIIAYKHSCIVSYPYPLDFALTGIKVSPHSTFWTRRKKINTKDIKCHSLFMKAINTVQL